MMDNFSFLYRSAQFLTLFTVSGLLAAVSKIALTISPTALTIILLCVLAAVIRATIGHWLFIHKVPGFARFSLLGGIIGSLLGLFI